MDTYRQREREREGEREREKEMELHCLLFIDGQTFLHDNARPHVARRALHKIQELKLEVPHHPSYSPYLVPTDNYLFQELDNFFQGKNITCEEEARTSFGNLPPLASQNSSLLA
ncbi:hypothetical protein FHG87_019540 [Trinorchestia longiramus]|nr:hypothetical protein FHG87_019540 [Trinorchestia longiramus]